MKACIVSFFMSNVHMQTVGLQRSVVEKYNKSKHTHLQIKIDGMTHAQGIDYFWAANGARPLSMKDVPVDHGVDCDVVLFLDIDAIPLNEQSIDTYLQEAISGKLVGNIQRSNHIKNDQHVFAAPSALAITKETYLKLGKPPAGETFRSDVCEEYTWAAEEAGIETKLYLPKYFDDAPFRYPWEGVQPPYWALKDGMPVYGIGTTFGDDVVEFYHNFQIFTPGQQERFWKRCEQELTK